MLCKILFATGEWMLVCHDGYASQMVMLHLQPYYLLQGARYRHWPALQSETPVQLLCELARWHGTFQSAFQNQQSGQVVAHRHLYAQF